MMIFCKNCKFFYGTEVKVDGAFSDINTTEYLYGKASIFLAHREYIRMCQHESCYKFFIKISPTDRTEFKERIAGQAQLNKDNNCKYYKRKWYLFWR